MVLGSAAAAYALEDGAGGTIDSLGDALWWAITTVTTVGYGDMFPVTPAGRGIAAFLMLSGIALFGVLTANIAAFFVEQDQEEGIDPISAKSTRCCVVSISSRSALHAPMRPGATHPCDWSCSGCSWPRIRG